MKTGALDPLNVFPATKGLDTAAPQELHFSVEPKIKRSAVFPQIYKDVYIATQT